VTLPVITAVTLTSTAPDTLLAKPTSVLTLQFTVTDETALPTGTQPPASFAVTIGPAGSAAPTFALVSGLTATTGTYRYTWTVPSNPAFSIVGYTISVADGAGNRRSANSAGVITIGTGLRACSCPLSLYSMA